MVNPSAIARKAQIRHYSPLVRQCTPGEGSDVLKARMVALYSEGESIIALLSQLLLFCKHPIHWGYVDDRAV